MIQNRDSIDFYIRDEGLDEILKYIMFSCDSCLKQFSTKESRISHVYTFHRKGFKKEEKVK